MTQPTVAIEMTREAALLFGLLICECGHPANNHFDYVKSCAHCDECKKYREKARVGKLIKRKGRK